MISSTRQTSPARLALLLAGALLAMALLVAACGSSASTDSSSPSDPASASPPGSIGTSNPASNPTLEPGSAAVSPGTVATTTTVDPGTLPQTDEKPAASGAQWDAGTLALWHAIVADDPALAHPFFFPLKAYEQVKGISDPDHDYNTRLLAAYDEDIHALHKALGSSAAQATFVRVDVPNAAQWIKPGVEYNKGAYWRVYDSKLVYTVGGQTKSFTIKSLISWRGQWYDVHLTAIR
jgi:hypothetical protein